MMTICPKCQYQRQASDGQTHPGICPRCGIAYAKFRGASTEQDADQTPVQQDANPIKTLDESSEVSQLPVLMLRETLVAKITYIPEKIDSGAFWGRVALFVLFVVWGANFMFGGVDWENINGSFLHNVNLPFHEFGHVLFSVMGHFMSILGGSLFQILLPLIITVAFSWQMHDNFAASITLWWCGQNFIDISPYIADAEHRAMPLILGLSEDYHDWGNLLTMTNTLAYANTFANISFAIGCGIMLISYCWGGWLLWQQKQRLSS